MNRTRALELILGSALLLGAACSAGSGVRGGQTSGTGSTGNGGGGNNGGNGNSGGFGTGNIILVGGTGAGASSGDGSACQETVSKPEQVMVTVSLPLDMFIMFDQSGSMNETVAGNTTKWNAIKTALTSFVNDPNTP